MSEETKICPYTGLRPFTEDESIYFRGRDEHIDQATRQLEKNKFIMLTGASGDGKSSLVYAGIIPNAKAGFLKASFSNWVVVDFRPERTPMGNLSAALGSHLGISADIVRTELSYGFSALVDMYKASPFYLDPGNEGLTTEKKRKASNLIILADQFEEFFTNPENFQKGVPSQEAMSVTNLLLETARIALEENLPIYVIVTMRSDFIGQCAAFRGLPEYIGFSQFFVPRLNRKELSEVIEEPSVLSGNKIARRLTERLIHDIVEGTDQLPILQHALNQVWKMADHGEAEMDLIHYAMVGGMPGKDLPTADAEIFNRWFNNLPAKVQECYQAPSLQNVLNTHANRLYIEAADNLKEKGMESFSEDDVRGIIATAFKCLTKIDHSRAVRNRMTLGEITAIINNPKIDYKSVGKVLDIFRDPENTLLRPFSDAVTELAENDVLDITHESLIRNWENLEQWADEEFASYTISLDFGQQLNRWVESKKSSDFLLYIGPLTYFENWINKDKPNAPWLARYLKGDVGPEKLERAKKIQANSAEFMKRSARKHRLTRTVVRYGPWRIAAVLGAIAMLTLSSFMVKNYVVRQNAHVMEEIREMVYEAIGTGETFLINRSAVGVEALMLKQVTLPELARGILDPLERINSVNSMGTLLVYQGHGEPRKETLQSLVLVDSMLTSLPAQEVNMMKVTKTIKEIIDLSETLELLYFYSPLPEYDSLRKRNSVRARDYVLRIFREQPNTFPDVNNLTVCMEHALNQKAFSQKEIDELLRILSPFSAAEQSPWIKLHFSRDKLARKGFYSTGFKFNGLYQEASYLYAAKGNVSMALQSLDSLLAYTENYYQGDYANVPDNASHVAAAFHRYGNTNEMKAYAAGYSKKKGVSEEEFYARVLARCKLYELATGVTNVNPQYDFAANLSLDYADDGMIDFFFNTYREVVTRTLVNPNAAKFQLALSYKDQAIIHLRKLEVSHRDSLGAPYQKLFDQAVALYKGVDENYLNEEKEVVELSNNDNFVVKRKFLFVYPDVRTPFHPNEPRLFHYFYVSGCFLDYIVKHDLFDQFYQTSDELRFFETFMRDYHFVESDLSYTASFPLKYETLVALEKQIVKAKAGSLVNLNFLYLYLGRDAAIHNDSAQVAYYYGQVDPSRMKPLFVNSFEPSFLFGELATAVSDLVKFNHFEDADKLVKIFERVDNRTSLYAVAAKSLLLEGIHGSGPDRLIDSATLYTAKRTSLKQVRTDRLQLVFAQTLQQPDVNISDAYKTIKNVEIKLLGIQFICRALAHNGRLYDAVANIPDDVSDADRIFFLWNIMHGFAEFEGQTPEPQWNEFIKNEATQVIGPILYVQENS